MFEIKKGIPVPTTGLGGRPGVYPFADMVIGDCIDIPVGDSKPDAVVRRVRVASATWRKRSKADCGFSARVVTEGGAMSVRLWKTHPRPAKGA